MLPHKWWTLGVTCLSWYFFRSLLWRFAGGVTAGFSRDLVRLPFPLFFPFLPSSGFLGYFSFSPLSSV